MATPGLSDEQKNQFHRDGYLVIPNFLTSDEVKDMLQRSKMLLEEFSIEGHPMTKFETEADEKHVGDEYFLTSGDKIRYFMEPDAVTNGQLNRPKEKAVNKIGHGLHELDPVFRRVTLQNPRLKQLAKDLAVHKDPRVLQSMVICKQASIGAVVPPHNDSTFLYTDPPSAIGFWFALEDCTPTNGALSFLPGSHLTTKIKKRFVRMADGGTGFETLLPDEPEPSTEGYKLETCSAGTLVLIHGTVSHKSERNASDRTRFIYTFHMIEGDGATYDEKNWLQPAPNMPFSRLFDD